jgi:hypothetical protein
MTGYIATVEYANGVYWLRFPGVEKAYAFADRPEDIIPHAQKFLTSWARGGGSPPSLDAAITAPTAAAFKEGEAKLVVFEWEPPRE